MDVVRKQQLPRFLSICLAGFVFLSTAVAMAEQRRQTVPRVYSAPDQRHGGDVETVGPRRCAKLQKYARKIGFITQWLEHGARLRDHILEIVDTFASVIETDAQSEASKAIQLRYLSQHRDLQSSLAARPHARDANFRAIAAASPASIP